MQKSPHLLSFHTPVPRMVVSWRLESSQHVVATMLRYSHQQSTNGVAFRLMGRELSFLRKWHLRQWVTRYESSWFPCGVLYCSCLLYIILPFASAPHMTQLLKWSVKDYLLKAALCHLGNDVRFLHSLYTLFAHYQDIVSTKKALDKYINVQPEFRTTREYTLLEVRHWFLERSKSLGLIHSPLLMPLRPTTWMHSTML